MRRARRCAPKCAPDQDRRGVRAGRPAATNGSANCGSAFKRLPPPPTAGRSTASSGAAAAATRPSTRARLRSLQDRRGRRSPRTQAFAAGLGGRLAARANLIWSIARSSRIDAVARTPVESDLAAGDDCTSAVVLSRRPEPEAPAEIAAHLAEMRRGARPVRSPGRRAGVRAPSRTRPRAREPARRTGSPPRAPAALQAVSVIAARAAKHRRRGEGPPEAGPRHGERSRGRRRRGLDLLAVGRSPRSDSEGPGSGGVASAQRGSRER